MFLGETHGCITCVTLRARADFGVTSVNYDLLSWCQIERTTHEAHRVALPLEASIRPVTRESIRHGHPSTLHLWWARRPLAAARAVIFAQMVDDPSAYVDTLRADPKLRPEGGAASRPV